MKLEEIATKSIEIIKESGEDGVSTSVLAEMLQVPKRRVYDVKAIMKAAGLINTSRDKSGTRIYWINTDGKISDDNICKIRSSVIKITTTGFITKVSNKGTEVTIWGTSPSMTIQKVEDNHR